MSNKFFEPTFDKSQFDSDIKKIQDAYTPTIVNLDNALYPDKPYAAFCYIAHEVLYHYCGGREKGLKIKKAKYNGIDHWFLVTPEQDVIDITKEQFPFDFPYNTAKPATFFPKRSNGFKYVVSESFLQK